MGEDEYYECYPSRIVITSILQAFASYAMGVVVLYLLGPSFALIFLVLVVLSLIMSAYTRCRFCYYFGKRCSFGLGLMAGSMMKKGSEGDFCEKRNVYPTAAVGFFITLLPIIVLAYLMVTDFTFTLGAMAAAYVLVALAPGFYLRPRVFCRHCRQGEIGCPAYNRMRSQGTESRSGS